MISISQTKDDETIVEPSISILDIDDVPVIIDPRIRLHTLIKQAFQKNKPKILLTFGRGSNIHRINTLFETVRQLKFKCDFEIESQQAEFYKQAC